MATDLSGKSSPTPPSEREDTSVVSSTSQGTQTSKNNDTEPPSPPPATFPGTAIDEFSQVPLLIDVKRKILSVHETLNHRLPLYNMLTSVFIQAVHWILIRAEKVVAFQWIVQFGDCMLLGLMDTMRNNLPLGLMDTMRNNLPQACLPSQEVMERLYFFLKKQISMAAAHLASYSVIQKLCRFVENILRLLEKVSGSLTFDKEKMDRVPWWFIPNFVLVIYEGSINRMLLGGMHYIHCCRFAVRSVRKAGAYIIAREHKIQSRRKASPRKALKTKPWIGYKYWVWMKYKVFEVFGISIAVPLPCLAVGSNMVNSPNQQIPSAEKKRKLSSVEEETTCSSEEEESLTHYMLNTLTSYTSGEDPDYVPGDLSPSSSDYDISDEDDDLESSLESFQELGLILKGKKGKNSPAELTNKENYSPHYASEDIHGTDSANAEPCSNNEPNPEGAYEKGNNNADKSDGDSIRSKEEIKSTSTPESRRRSLLRW
ncbi:hypothetical protein SK128_025808 [Halocaridina rubra]|uniref:Uncharacterized protein n=1 Tax=Halocaridina rubra TaxID=373956 RepID=A0AAN8WU28_HALRR